MAWCEKLNQIFFSRKVSKYESNYTEHAWESAWMLYDD